MPTGDAKKAAARPPLDRVLERVTVDQDGCWIWTGATRGNGDYGCIQVGSRTDGTRRVEATHRVVYEAMAGPIPEGLVLDHLCRVTRCCNPGHLEPVTQQVNAQRMVLSEQERQRRREWGSGLHRFRRAA